MSGGALLHYGMFSTFDHAQISRTTMTSIRPLTYILILLTWLTRQMSLFSKLSSLLPQNTNTSSLSSMHMSLVCQWTIGKKLLATPLVKSKRPRDVIV